MFEELSVLGILFLTGTISGFFSSTPLGPINLLIADSVISRFDFNLKAFLSGVLLADVVFALLAFWGYYSFFEGSTIGKWTSVAGGSFIVVLGTISLLKVINGVRKDPRIAQMREERGHSWKDFSKGLVLCGSNPAFLLFWVYIATSLEKFGIEPVTGELVFLLLGVIVGDLLWFGGYIRILKKGADKLKGKYIFYIRLGISLVLIALGGSTIIMSFF